MLGEMKREYCLKDFEHVVDFLRARVPGLTIATDIICGFPTETEQDFNETMSLCEKYRFPSLFINQFFRARERRQPKWSAYRPIL